MVAIATALSNQDASDKFTDGRWPAEFTGINTTFELKQVLKGKAAEKVVVLHFKLGSIEQGKAVIDGPG